VAVDALALELITTERCSLPETSTVKHEAGHKSRSKPARG